MANNLCNMIQEIQISDPEPKFEIKQEPEEYEEFNKTDQENISTINFIPSNPQELNQSFNEPNQFVFNPSGCDIDQEFGFLAQAMGNVKLQDSQPFETFLSNAMRSVKLSDSPLIRVRKDLFGGVKSQLFAQSKSKLFLTRNISKISQRRARIQELRIEHRLANFNRYRC